MHPSQLMVLNWASCQASQLKKRRVEQGQILPQGPKQWAASQRTRQTLSGLAGNLWKLPLTYHQPSGGGGGGWGGGIGRKEGQSSGMPWNSTPGESTEQASGVWRGGGRQSSWEPCSGWLPVVQKQDGRARTVVPLSSSSLYPGRLCHSHRGWDHLMEEEPVPPCPWDAGPWYIPHPGLAAKKLAVGQQTSMTTSPGGQLQSSNHFSVH